MLFRSNQPFTNMHHYYCKDRVVLTIADRGRLIILFASEDFELYQFNWLARMNVGFGSCGHLFPVQGGQYFLVLHGQAKPAKGGQCNQSIQYGPSTFFCCGNYLTIGTWI